MSVKTVTYECPVFNRFQVLYHSAVSDMSCDPGSNDKVDDHKQFSVCPGFNESHNIHHDKHHDTTNTFSPENVQNPTEVHVCPPRGQERSDETHACYKDKVLRPTRGVCTDATNGLAANDDVSSVVTSVAKAIKNNTFWTKFKISPSPPDGHCFIHATVSSFNSQVVPERKINSDFVIKSLWDETHANFRRYTQFVENNSERQIIAGLYEYAHLKRYNTSFGDLVPEIMVNALNTTLIIISEISGKYNTQLFSPSKCSVEIGWPCVMVLKRGEHYDGITTSQEKIPVPYQKSVNSIKIDAASAPAVPSNVSVLSDVSAPDISGNISPPAVSGDISAPDAPSNVSLLSDVSLPAVSGYISAPAALKNVSVLRNVSVPAVAGNACTTDAEMCYTNITKTFMKVTGLLQYISVLNYMVSPTPTNFTTVSDFCDLNHSDDKGSNDHVYMNDMKRFRMSHLKNLIVSHLNINGIRNKFVDISDILTENLTDILFLTESKLDASFPNAQFTVPGFKILRVDRNSQGGGIMAMIRSDLAFRERSDLEAIMPSPVESMVLEFIVRKEKWLIICVYNPHNKHKHVCCKAINSLLDQVQTEVFSSIFVLGDTNINMLCRSDSKCLQNVLELHGLDNIIKEPTCFKSKTPTLIDVILTNCPRRVAATININTGASDFHHLVGFTTKLHVPRNNAGKITYRTYKNFKEDDFRQDLASAPFHVADIFDDFDDSFWFNQTLLSDIIDGHAPLKQRRPVKMPVPFMNSKLRKACHRKAMAHNKFFKMGRTDALWSEFRKCRNHVTKIKAVSMKNYFKRKMFSGPWS